jgi:hypothetical protein
VIAGKGEVEDWRVGQTLLVVGMDFAPAQVLRDAVFVVAGHHAGGAAGAPVEIENEETVFHRTLSISTALS